MNKIETLFCWIVLIILIVLNLHLNREANDILKRAQTLQKRADVLEKAVAKDEKAIRKLAGVLGYQP